MSYFLTKSGKKYSVKTKKIRLQGKPKSIFPTAVRYAPEEEGYLNRYPTPNMYFPVMDSFDPS